MIDSHNTNIQSRSRVDENIKILMLRDIMYDRAKVLNNIIIFLSLLPIIYTILVNNLKFEIFDSNNILGIDEFGVILALVVTSIISIVSSKISSLKLNSNILRQAYDCKVLMIRGNKFIIPDAIKIDLNNIIIENKDRIRYENWYPYESRNHWCHDILICQIDNLLYTMYLYSKLKKTMDVIMWALGLVIIALITYALSKGIIVSMFFKFIVALSPILAVLYKTWSKLKNNIYDYANQMTTIKSDIIKGNIDNTYLEAIQDKILINRLNDVLVPKLLREYYLKPGNEYKLELDKINNFIIQTNEVI